MKFETIFFQMLNMKFCSKQVYDGKYIKATVRIFNGEVNTIFWNGKVPKEECALHLYSSNKHWFCHKNEEKELSLSLFRRMYKKDKKTKVTGIMPFQRAKKVLKFQLGVLSKFKCMHENFLLSKWCRLINDFLRYEVFYL